MGLIGQLAGTVAPAAPGANPFHKTPEARALLGENDRANAARLLAAYGADMIYVSGKGWGIWDGTRFSFDDGKHKAAALAAKLPDLIEEEIAATWESEIDEVAIKRKRKTLTKTVNEENTDFDIAKMVKVDRVTALRKHATKLGNVDKREKALKDCEWQVLTGIHELDSDPWAFVVKNGVLDLKAVHASAPRPEGEKATAEALAEWRAGWIAPPRRDFKPTKCAGVVFLPAASCPEWENFMGLILPDEEVRACLQRALGAILFGANTAQVCLMLRGSGGNGKSTLMQIIGELLGIRGGYAAPCKVEMFLQTQNASAGQATPEEVDLPGARGLLASEPAATDVLSAKKIKALTGGDPRPARALGMPQFIYRPSGIPIIQFNRTPKIKDEDEGTRRRLVFIPLDVNLRDLPPEKRRNPLEVESALKRELPGILNWLLDGFRDFQSRLEKGQGTPPGIDPPEVMQRLKADLMESADPVGEFVKDCTKADAEGRIKTTDFFRAFEAYARETGARIYQAATVREIMQEKGYPKRKSNGQQVFAGLSWNDNPMLEHYLAQPAPRDQRDQGGYAPPSPPPSNIHPDDIADF